jgi:hypothetical protein
MSWFLIKQIERLYIFLCCIRRHMINLLVFRIITNSRSRDSCRELFKKLNILPLQPQYVFSLLLFVAKNRENFILKSEIHCINTKYNNNLHYPICNLIVFQKGINYFGIKAFNTLRTGSQHIGFWLSNVADRAPNIWLLGHAMLQNTIHCSSAMQTHNLCVVYVLNVLLSSQ